MSENILQCQTDIRRQQDVTVFVRQTSRLSPSSSDSDPDTVLVMGVWARRCFGEGVLSLLSWSPVN